MGNRMTPKQSRFFELTEEKLRSIDAISDAALNIHRKILYVSFIDSLSALVCPAVRQNRERFIEFVIRFGSWPNAERVNSPLLVRNLALDSDPAFDSVRKLVSENLHRWGHGDVITLDRDLDAGVIATYWLRGQRFEQPVEGTPWHRLKHVELLYKYRNALVHNFKPLGPDAEEGDNPEPYYLYTTQFSSSNHSPGYWELIYPTSFLQAIANTIFDATKLHICSTELDPFEILGGGRY